MTSLEKALKIAVDQALITHDKGYEAAAFHHLHRAVKLLAGLAIAQEAAALRQNQPPEAPEASKGSNVPPDWESRCKSQAAAINGVLQWLEDDPAIQQITRESLIDWLKAVLEGKPGLGCTLYALAPNAVIKDP